MSERAADRLPASEPEVPRLHLDGEWPRGPSGVSYPISGGSGERWTHAGYRAEISGIGTGVEAVRTGFPLMENIRGLVAPDSGELHGHQVVLGGESESAARWATGLDLPVVLVDLPRGPSSSSWTVSLGSPRIKLSADGRALQVRSGAGDTEALFVVSDGRLAAVHEAGGVVVRCMAPGPARLLAAGARNRADLARVLDLLDRRGVAGLLRQRSMHAEQLHRGGVGIAHSRAELSRLYEWAKIAADARVGSWLARRAEGRNSADAEPIAALAAALLAAGLPAHARAWIRAGESTAGSDDLVPALRRLRERFRLWAGGDPAVAPAPEVPPLPEAGDVPVPALARVAAGEATDEELIAILILPHREWSIRPDASRGEVALAPALPPDGMLGAVSRLRIGRTVLDLRLRPRAGMVAFAVRRGAGPKIFVSCDLRRLSATEVLLDGEPIGGAAPRFEVEGEHELLIHPGA
ncbi:MAG TPA: hypothetical protein VK012_01570 [Gemmatimonadales bacterium]|nr:hypothetical protein [Gemmatimonadales bacterium]